VLEKPVADENLFKIFVECPLGVQPNQDAEVYSSTGGIGRPGRSECWCIYLIRLAEALHPAEFTKGLRQTRPRFSTAFSPENKVPKSSRGYS